MLDIRNAGQRRLHVGCAFVARMVCRVVSSLLRMCPSTWSDSQQRADVTHRALAPYHIQLGVQLAPFSRSGSPVSRADKAAASVQVAVWGGIAVQTSGKHEGSVGELAGSRLDLCCSSRTDTGGASSCLVPFRCSARH